MKRKQNLRRTLVSTALGLALGAQGVFAAAPAMTPSAATVLQAPLQPQGQFFASTDTKHENNDFLVLKPGETRTIPLRAGVLKRLWSTAVEPDKIDLSLLNGSKLPLLSNGRASQGEFALKAYTLYPEIKAAAVRQLKAGAALVVTNHAKADNKFFYQAYVLPSENSGPAYAAFDGGTVALGGRKVTIAAGKTSAPLLVRAGGKSGVISEVRIQATPANLDAWSNLYLRIDRLKITSRAKGIVSSVSEGQSGNVYASLAALAGQFYELKPVENAMTSFDGKTLVLRWPMPFNAAIDDVQLSLENKGTSSVDVTLGATVRTARSASPYMFCARSGSALAQKGKPLPILKLKGAGAFVGLNFAVSPTAQSSRRAFAYLEGNENIVADGHSYEGTGTEDFFNSAWYFPSTTFSKPFHGLTYKGESPPRVSAYRLLIPDAIPFKKELTFQQEVGRKNNADDLDYHWVAFWYQKAPLQYEIADSLAVAKAEITADSEAPQSGQGAGNSALIWMALIVAAIVAFGWSLTRKKRS